LRVLRRSCLSRPARIAPQHGRLEAVKTEIPKEPNQIAAAVEACVKGAIESERPFRHINDFLLLLRRAKWTETEVLEVQSGVLSDLKKRRDPRHPFKFR